MACQHDVNQMCNTCIYECASGNRSEFARKIQATTTNWSHWQAEYELPVFLIADAANVLDGFYVIISQSEDSDRSELQIQPSFHWLVDLYPIIECRHAADHSAAEITYENYRQAIWYYQSQVHNQNH